MENENSNSGAKAAFRGFRTQTIYILYRLLSQKTNEIFVPEGEEDLLIKRNGKKAEVIQVKNYTSNLSLSNLSPKKEDAFFNRSIQLLQKNKIGIKLVSFGKLGKELADYQKNKVSKTISKKLINSHGFNQKQVNLLFKYWIIETYEEEILLQEIKKILNSHITAIDWNIAFELLMYWLYVASENKTEITKQSLLQKLQSIGKFINERHIFLTQFGTTVKNIAKENKGIETHYLEAEFYNGASAKYAHIKANLDILRPSKLEAISQCFQKSNITIIHGASGQGKSTLSYRYIYENYPSEYAFEIQYSQYSDVKNIISTLKTLSKPFDKPFLIYIDVLPTKTFWIEFINELSLIKNCNILISIREEDLNRSQKIEEWVNPSTLKLNFSKKEAEEIYKQFEAKKTITKFLDFEETWLSFGGDGPLLEFAYLVNQGKKLEDRLENQVNNLLKNANEHNEWKQLELLKLVALADQYNCRIDLKKVIKQIQLKDYKRTLKWFQDEYLFRKSEDGNWLEGLHPVRSTILTNLLYDFEIHEPTEVFATLINVLKEDDIGLLLLHYFADFTDYQPILNIIATYQTSSWTNYVSIFDSLMWLGVKKYVDNNYHYIKEIRNLVGKSWLLFVPPIYYQNAKFDFSNLTKRMDEKTLEQVNLLKNKISNNQNVFHEAKEWLDISKTPIFEQCNENDLSNLGKILFWHHQFKFKRDFQLERYDFNFIFEETPLKPLSDLMYGLFFYNEETKKIWTNYKHKFLERFRIANQIPLITEDSERIKLHFIVQSDFQHNSENTIDISQEVLKKHFRKVEDINLVDANLSIHDQTMSLIDVIRKAIPKKQKYASQGYGHQVNIIDMPFDDSHKDMNNNPIDWISDYYGYFRSLIKYNDRADTWFEIAQQLFENRKRILDLFQSFINVISKYYKTGNFKEIETYWYSYKSDWYNQDLDYDYLFPKEVIDKWGFTRDTVDKKDNKSQNPYLLKIHPHLKTIKDFQQSISNFFRQSDKVIQFKTITQGVSKRKIQENRELFEKQGYSFDFPRLSVINLLHAIQALPKYHQSFKQYFAKYTFTDLEILEQQEIKVYKEMLFAWQNFNYQPFKKEKSFSSKLQRRIKSIQENIHTKISNNLKQLKVNKTIEDYEIVEEVERNKIWIVVYGKDFINLSASIDDAIKAIQSALGNTKLPSTKSLILELEYPSFSIIPLIDDVAVSDFYFEIPLFKMTSQNHDLISPLTVKELSIKDLRFLEINRGQDIITELNAPKQLNLNVQTIAVQLNHITQLEKIYQQEKVSKLLIGTLILDKIIKLNSIWVDTQELGLKCMNTFYGDDKPMKELAKHQDFWDVLYPIITAIGELSKLFEYFQYLDIENDLIDFTLVQKHNDKFSSIVQSSGMVYVYWSNEIFNKNYQIH